MSQNLSVQNSNPAPSISLCSYVLFPKPWLPKLYGEIESKTFMIVLNSHKEVPVVLGQKKGQCHMHRRAVYLWNSCPHIRSVVTPLKGRKKKRKKERQTGIPFWELMTHEINQIPWSQEHDYKNWPVQNRRPNPIPYEKPVLGNTATTQACLHVNIIN